MCTGLIFSNNVGLQLKVNQKWTPLNAFFKDFDYISRLATFRRGFLLKVYFFKTYLCDCFCNLSSLWVRNSKLSRHFFKIFICLYLTIPNVILSWKQPIRIIMLHCTDMKTSLSCDYIASSFIIIFTSYMNKSYKNAVQY